MEKDVYRGKIIRVTEETIEGITWERAYLPDGVIVFPITDDGKILLVKEKRPHENPNIRIKPVSGILEHHKGTPAENAQREMQEEIGHKAHRLELLWHQKASGTVNNNQYFFVARNLEEAKLPNPDGEETIMEVIAYAPDELYQLLLREEIRWSMSTLGLFKLLRHLGTVR